MNKVLLAFPRRHFSILKYFNLGIFLAVKCNNGPFYKGFLVAWALSESEAGGELKTSLLFLC